MTYLLNTPFAKKCILKTIVIKPRPAWLVDPGAGPIRVCQKTGQCNNSVDPTGQPVTRARPGQDPVFFFLQMWDLKPISIYTLCFYEKNFFFFNVG